jgi:YYY domain-containing protein
VNRLSRRRARAILLALLLLGGIFRFQGLDWDSGHHLHPDERFISMVEEKIAFPDGPGAYFDSKRSTLNPYNRGEGSFVYGTLPMVLAKAVAPLFGKKGYDGTHLVGRGLSGVFDLVTVWLVYRITRRFAHRRAALFAAGLSAFCVLGIQLSHFWAVDAFLTTFTAAALLGAVRIAQARSGIGGDLATGVAVGMAAACKITALALFAPVGIAFLVRALAQARGRASMSSHSRMSSRSSGGIVRAFLLEVPRGLALLAAAAVTVRVFLPHVFLGPSPLSFRLDPRWIEDLSRLKALSGSVAGFPPALQWAGRSLLFPVENFVLWGAGVAFGVAAILALFWSVGAIFRRRQLALAPLTLYVLFLFLYHGLTVVKSIRYFYPAYPALAVLTGVAFSSWLARARFPRLARAAALGVLAVTFLWAVAFTSIYRRPNTRVEATRWIYSHVPPPKAFANESWDDGLPMPMPGHDPGRYAGPSMPLFDPDSPQKVETLVQALTKADWVAVTSGRVYMNVTRVPAVFPMSIAYYRALFDGSLGFERAADFTSYPSLGPLRFPDDRAEEQFTVYDHPRVLLFKKTPAFSPQSARALLLEAIPQTPPTMHEWEKWPRALRRVSSPVRPDRRSLEGAETAAYLEPPGGNSLGAAVLWYLGLALVGLVGAPIAFAAFPRFSDRGFGFARILGLVLVTYVMTFALTARVMVNGRRTALLCLALVAIASAWCFLRNRHDVFRFVRENRRALLQSEIVFAAGFLLFLGLRALNPEIFWGEKPMDFSILNILVRTRSLPPSDPWLAGAPLGYYTFGQEMVVFLTLLTNLSTRFTFNLAFGLLGGVILQGAFSLARNWGGRLRAGIAGAALTLLLGNLAGLREWLVRKRPLDWDYFWATSRVVKDTINEYPFWSLVFADLHAHVLAIPIFLLFAAAALHLVRLHGDPLGTWGQRLRGAVLVGFVAACQALTNAWDVPLLTGLLLLVVPASAALMSRLSLGGLLRAGAALLASAASAYLFARLLWFRAGGRPGIGKNLEPSTLGVDQLTVFGLFLFIAFGWWIATATSRLADRGVRRPARWAIGLVLAAALGFLAIRFPDAFLLAGVLLFVAAFFLFAEEREDRLALGFLATAFFLVVFTQRFYIVDRMNTFFKLYLEAWLLFAIATAVLVFRGRDRRGVIDRWAWPGKAGTALLALTALFTSVTAGRAAVSRHFAPYSGPSLDGLRYLEEQRPGEYRAVEWMRRNVAGTPVVLEAQGPSYQEFGRISMLTGLPTVLGWDYHVKQRGNPESEIETRKAHVRMMYSHPDPERSLALLRRYGVGYVYVGPLERKTYPAAGLQKFGAKPKLFQLAYENPEVRIYRVAGSPSQDVLVPVKETLPASAASGPPPDEQEETPAIAAEPSADAPWANLKEPRGIAVDGRGRVWIADFGNSRIRVFDREGGYLGGWGGRGSGEFGFRELCGVAIRGDALYVADTWNGRVRAYTVEGLLRGTAGDLYGPRGIAVAPNGRVWVTDTGNHRVVSYGPLLDDVRIHGRKGSGPGEFSSPIGIAASPSGEIYVADTVNRRIQVLGPDGSVLRAFAFPGWGENQEPGLAVDADGTIWAADPGAGSVVALYPEGRLKARLATDETGKRLANPTGLAIDAKDRILYVVNSATSTVSRIRLPAGAAPGGKGESR